MFWFVFVFVFLFAFAFGSKLPSVAPTTIPVLKAEEAAEESEGLPFKANVGKKEGAEGESLEGFAGECGELPFKAEG